MFTVENFLNVTEARVMRDIAIKAQTELALEKMEWLNELIHEACGKGESEVKFHTTSYSIDDYSISLLEKLGYVVRCDNNREEYKISWY